MKKTTKEIYDSVRNTCAASDEFKELMGKEWEEVKEKTCRFCSLELSKHDGDFCPPGTEEGGGRR